MRYYLDTEFNGFGGELISIALVREDGESVYFIFPEPERGYEPWVAENVVPILDAVPDGAALKPYRVDRGIAALGLSNWLRNDPDPIIVTDWPDDIRYFCELAITGPGLMINVKSLKFEMHRVDAYPTALMGAIQHNAWWDAQALLAMLMVV